ncbi:MAG: VOC family protein [Hyphomonas sp.]|uniref:VOC family protein n=1 Tax=Hyphomonas sp. TaxID=87 RepID=UPI0032671176
MSSRPIHVTLVTLGVADVQESAAFYERMGLKRAKASQESVVFFDMGGLALGLFGRASLAQDVGVPEDGDGFRAVTFAWNQPSAEEVDDALDRAVAAGAKLVKPAEKVFWGGYSGYFSDPDDHLWEMAHNPFSPLLDDGSMEL